MPTWAYTGKRGTAFTNPDAANGDTWLQEARSAVWLSCEPPNRKTPEVNRKRAQAVQRVLEQFADRTDTHGDELKTLLRALVRTQGFELSCGTTPTARHILCGQVSNDLLTLYDLDRSDLVGGADELRRMRAVVDALVEVVAVRASVGAWGFAPASRVVPSPLKHRTQLARYRGGLPPFIAATELSKLDWDAATKELLRSEREPIVRFRLRQRMRELRKVAEASSEQLPRDLIARAATARSEWERTLSPDEKQTLTRAHEQLQDETGRCHASKQLLAERIETARPASMKEALSLLPDPALELILPELARCYDRAKATSAALALKSWLTWRGGRHTGPRAAAMSALRPEPRAPQEGHLAAQAKLLPSPVGIARVTAAEDGGAMLEFKQEVRKEDVLKCWRTGYVERINRYGEIIHEEDCRVVGSREVKRPAVVRKISVPFNVARRAKAARMAWLMRPVAMALYPSQEDADADRKLLAFMNVPVPL